MTKQTEEQQKHWYAIHTYSGYEDAVARYLEQRVESLDMQDKIFKIIVPKEKRIKMKGSARQTVEDKLYPGYVFVNMVMTDDSWYVVRNTPRVTGFVGADSTIPTPMSDEEMTFLINKISKNETSLKIDLKIGDVVKIADGPFKDYDGKVSEIDEEKGKIKVLVSVFGRETPLGLDFLQVKKI